MINNIYNRSFISSFISEIFTIDRDGNIYKNNVKQNKNNYYSIKHKDGSRHTYSIKNLYHRAFKKQYCIDEIKDAHDELWRPIENTEQKYYASTHGRIKSYCGHKAKLLNASDNGKGYLRVNIGGKNQLVHRIIAKTFKEKFDDKADTVHHRDRNKKNNFVNNLEWLSRAENARIARKKIQK